MPDWNAVIEALNALLELLFGPQVPLWVPRALGWGVAAGATLVALYALLWLVSQIWEVWDEKFRTRFYNAEERRRSERRRRFASRVEGKLRDLEDQEEWKDFRFAELEAEVEAEGRRRVASVLPWRRTESGLRREKSLSRALKVSQEEIVLLEGDPGSGKSVALRHVAQEMARQAMSARSTRSIVPLYVNLKGLDRAALAREMGGHHARHAEPSHIRQLLTSYFDETELRTLAFDLKVVYDALPGGEGTANKARELVALMQRTGQMAALVNAAAVVRPHLNWNGMDGKAGEVPINSALIHAFVRHSFSWSRDIEEFLDEEFERGREAGTWLFLFDSFDELPDVLGSTEADDTIRQYADAIEDFLGGMGRCRGIIASRHFRGPKSRWPRFRILPLTEERRQLLIRRAELKPAVESDLRGQLGMASEAIRAMVSNPMFLGLLCEHMRQGEQFPHNTHEVFEGYISTRLERDRERLERRFGLDLSAIRAVAESAAFAMAADTTLGLSPTRAALSAAIQRLGLDMPAPLEPTLDALEYIKLGRSEGTSAQGEEPRFTFAHRRFQEYFATSIVLRDPHRVPPRRLLTDARWRETAVVLCQTQPLPVLEPLLDEARALLAGMLEEVKEYLVDVEEVDGEEEEGNPLPNENANEARKEEHKREKPIVFPWPVRSLHLLRLLQKGFAGRSEELADDIREKTGKLLLSASWKGMLLDEKWALSVAGIAPQRVLLILLRKAYNGESRMVQEIAYWQLARLERIPEDIIFKIISTLVKSRYTGRLRREHNTLQTYLSRLDRSKDLLTSLYFLSNLRRIEFFLAGTLILSSVYSHSSDIFHKTSITLACVLLTFLLFELPWHSESRTQKGGDAILEPYMIWVITITKFGQLFVIIINSSIFIALPSLYLFTCTISGLILAYIPEQITQKNIGCSLRPIYYST